jgi:hypothetical protein
MPAVVCGFGEAVARESAGTRALSAGSNTGGAHNAAASTGNLQL